MKILGLACGIASVGWALLDDTKSCLTITAAGVWSFDAPETPKKRVPLNALRQQHRSQRRTISRRRQRMNEIRRLFHEAGLLEADDRDALSLHLNPWGLRAEAFSRRLSGPELAVALGHIAVRRGFKSNSKREVNAIAETSLMKKALAATAERLQHYRTVGLMFAGDPEYQDRKRNRDDFTRSVLRADLEHEVRQIFAEQRRRGNRLASADLEESFARIAFYQRPRQDSETLVGACRFEPAEKRTARRGYSFELFRLLSRLANLTLSVDGKHRRLTAAEMRQISADFGAAKKISYRSVRELLALDSTTRFVGVAEKDEKNDVVARQGNAAEGTFALRRAVGPESWQLLVRHPALVDRIAELLTFRDDAATIRAGLLDIVQSVSIVDAIMDGVATGAFAQFNGTGHLSAKAARALLPALRRGAGYAAACEAAGYDHDAAGKVSLEDLRNPVARKAMTEVLKQIRAVIAAHGRPDVIHVGLQREIGKSAEERDDITRGIERQNKKREASREELEALLGRRTHHGELLRYELWKEQDGTCLYTGAPIDPKWIAAGDMTVSVSHILPWSRFGDDSFLNKTLCLASAGQAKADRTPYEWFDATDWHAFTDRVEACKAIKGIKKRGYYLRQNAQEIEADFRNRHLSDTRYIARFLLLYLHQTYPDIRAVRARSIQLAAKLRGAWDLNDLKHDESGKRKEDDRHRAVDAIVLAAISEGMLETLAEAAREAERTGVPGGFDVSHAAPPAAGFAHAVRTVVDDVFTARAERRRMRGETHAATIKRIRTVDGENKPTVFERKAVEKLTLEDLETIPTPAPYGRIKDPQKLRDEMVATLQHWIERDRPKDDWPRSPKGDLIRKVRLATREEIRVAVRGGTADRGEMARVDVFRKLSKSGRPSYHLVPIYPHQIADRQGYSRPPDRAIVSGRSESTWEIIGPDAAFLFSLFSHSLLEVAKADGRVVRGYFKGVDRATGAIAIALPDNMRGPPVRFGARFLEIFNKLHVDRLGRIAPVKREIRTWRGENL